MNSTRPNATRSWRALAIRQVRSAWIPSTLAVTLSVLLNRIEGRPLILLAAVATIIVIARRYRLVVERRGHRDPPGRA